MALLVIDKINLYILLHVAFFLIIFSYMKLSDIPKKEPSDLKVTVSFVITPRRDEQILQVAQEKGWSKSEILRMIVDSFFEKELGQEQSVG